MTDLAPPIRIVVIDPLALVRAGLVALLERHAAFRVVGEAGNDAEASALIARELPDIVLFEPDGIGDDQCELIVQAHVGASRARLMLVTQSNDTVLHRRAVRLGAMGIVLKDQPAETLLKAIHKVHAGEAWLDRAMMADVITQFARGQGAAVESPEQARIALLTPREREVIGLIGKGMKNREVAEQLSVSEFTVRHHLTSIFSKLQVSDRLELIIFAYKFGLVDLPK